MKKMYNILKRDNYASNKM